MASAGKRVRENFPSAELFLSIDLPLIRQRKPDVWEAFLHWSQVPEKLGRYMLDYREAGWPIVGVTRRPKINGLFSNKTPRVIYISHRVLQAYQDNKPGSEILLESTILHELVHLGNFIGGQFALDKRELHSKTGKDGKKKGGYTMVNGQSREVGKAFEHDAYGDDINLKNMHRFSLLECGTCNGMD